MAKDDARLEAERRDPDNEEARTLLADDHGSSAESDIDDNNDLPPLNTRPDANGRPKSMRQSSLAQYRPDGTPRTSHRVRFDVSDDDDDDSVAQNGHVNGSAWVDDDDYMNGDRSPGEWRDGERSRLPLLTGIEAPSITVASADIGFNEEDLLESARPKSGMKSAFMNMANSIIGAGIIGQPYAFRQAGMVAGTVLLIALTITVDWTIQLIVINSKLSGANSFQGTVQHCFGKSGLIAISIAQWAFAFGGMVAFCIIVGDTIPRVMAAVFPSLSDMPFLWLLTNRKAIIVLFVLGISYPLSLYRDIAKLAKASALALVSMLIILVTVITQGPRVPDELKGQLRGSLLINTGFIQAIGVISFAFVCHHNSLLIYGSLRRPTLDRFARVTHFSTGISMVACLVMALAGYLTFGDKTQGNVLNNFPKDNILVNIARLCFGFNMLTTLPLEAFVCREVMTNYYFADEPWNPHRHIIFTTSLVVSSMTLALMTCDLGAVFELIGATSACALAYILPPLCYIKLSSRSWKTYAAIVCVVFGSGVMIITVLLSAYKIMNNEGAPETCG